MPPNEAFINGDDGYVKKNPRCAYLSLRHKNSYINRLTKAEVKEENGDKKSLNIDG